MDYSESEQEEFTCVFPASNRFENASGHLGERGNEWTHPRRSKRKKVSSVDSTQSFEMNACDSLENADKLSSLHDFVVKNSFILNEVKKKQTVLCETSKESKSHIDELRKHVQLSDRITSQLSKCMTTLAYKSIDAEAMNRRQNIIVWGVSEKCKLRLETLVLNFFEDEMAIDTSTLVIDKAHRIGSVVHRNRDSIDLKRPILVRFRDLSDAEKVMKRAYRLKGTPFGIGRDYPREIAIARKELYKSEEATYARQNRHKLQIRYPARLFINDRLVCDKFPEWYQYIKASRLTCIEGIPGLDSNITKSDQSIAYESDEQRHDVDETICTRSSTDGKHTDAGEVKPVKTNHPQNVHLSSVKVNAKSRGSENAHSRKNSKTSQNNTRQRGSPIKISAKKQNALPKGITKRASQIGHANSYCERGSVGSKYRHGEKPEHIAKDNNNYDKYGLLIASEDCVTQF